MMVLHPFSSGRAQDKVETWAFVTKLREAGFKAVDKLIDEPMAYPDFLRDMWGKEDLLIIEDDKVAEVADVEEISSCAISFCAYPYPFSNHFTTKLSDWSPFPYSLGFTKFSLEAQIALPVERWYKPGKHYGLDRMIEEPLQAIIGPVHLHDKMIKHNHPATIGKVFENRAALTLQRAGLR